MEEFNRPPPLAVALRKESVDRNSDEMSSQEIFWASLSARRAWIEIAQGRRVSGRTLWSLSARRAWIEIIGLTYDGLIASGRSPQGERG